MAAFALNGQLEELDAGQRIGAPDRHPQGAPRGTL
jgi:hypothetical protein